MTSMASPTRAPARTAHTSPYEQDRPLRDQVFDASLIALLPTLRGFARGLCGNVATADDLVQGACASAMTHSASFVHGTSMRAWLFTILRNQYYSQLRKRRREVEDADGSYAGGLATLPNQDHVVDLSDMMQALGRLKRSHRDVLKLVGEDGLSYEAAALSSGCAVGTIKSRTHRARRQLAALLA